MNVGSLSFDFSRLFSKMKSQPGQSFCVVEEDWASRLTVKSMFEQYQIFNELFPPLIILLSTKPFIPPKVQPLPTGNSTSKNLFYPKEQFNPVH